MRVSTRKLGSIPAKANNSRFVSKKIQEAVQTCPSGSNTKGKSDSKTYEVLKSYAKCIRLWHQVNFRGIFSFSEKAQITHLKSVFKGHSRTNYPKVFKGMLADRFSIETQQERPEVPLSGDNLFYSQYDRKFFNSFHPVELTSATDAK